MQFNKEINQYLKGEKFSNALAVDFSTEKFLLQTRINKLVDLTKDKNLIHFGCADHLDLIDYKMNRGNWLHGLLIQNTKHCIGIDINYEAINYLKEKYKIPNLYCADIEKENNIDYLFENQKWDYLLLGELIEHINNPVAFLKNLHQKFNDKTESIVLTAPNVYNVFNAKNIRKNIELINSDHRYWFTPYTLTKVLVESGFTNCELSFVEHVKLPFHKEIIKHLFRLLKKPLYFKASYFSTLVITAKF